MSVKRKLSQYTAYREFCKRYTTDPDVYQTTIEGSLYNLVNGLTTQTFHRVLYIKENVNTNDISYDDFSRSLTYLKYFSNYRGFPIRHLIIHTYKHTMSILESGVLDGVLETIFVCLKNCRKIKELFGYINRNLDTLQRIIVVEQLPSKTSSMFTLMMNCNDVFDYDFIGDRMVLYNKNNASNVLIIDKLKSCFDIDSIVKKYATNQITNKVHQHVPTTHAPECDFEDLKRRIGMLPEEIRLEIISRLPCHIRYKIAMYLRLNDTKSQPVSYWYRRLGFFTGDDDNSENEVAYIRNFKEKFENRLFHDMYYKYRIVKLDGYNHLNKMVEAAEWFKNPNITLNHLSIHYDQISRILDMKVLDGHLKTLVIEFDFSIFNNINSIGLALHRYFKRPNVLERCLVSINGLLYEFLLVHRPFKFKYKIVSLNRIFLLYTKNNDMEIPKYIESDTFSKIFGAQLSFNKIIV